MTRSPVITLATGALTIDEGADYLRISRSSVWRMIRDGALPVVRLRGRTVLRRADLERVLETNLQSA